MLKIFTWFYQLRELHNEMTRKDLPSGHVKSSVTLLLSQKLTWKSEVSSIILFYPHRILVGSFGAGLKQEFDHPDVATFGSQVKGGVSGFLKEFSRKQKIK